MPYWIPILLGQDRDVFEESRYCKSTSQAIKIKVLSVSFQIVESGKGEWIY